MPVIQSQMTDVKLEKHTPGWPVDHSWYKEHLGASHKLWKRNLCILYWLPYIFWSPHDFINEIILKNYFCLSNILDTSIRVAIRETFTLYSLFCIFCIFLQHPLTYSTFKPILPFHFQSSFIFIPIYLTQMHSFAILSICPHLHSECSFPKEHLLMWFT